MADSIDFRYDDWNRRLLTANFVVDKRTDVLWRYMRMALSFLHRIPSVAAFETTTVDDDTQRVAFVRRSANVWTLRVGRAGGESDDTTRTMRMETLKSRWGTYTATLRVSEDGEHASRVTYDSAFGMLTFMGMRVPFVDAKLQRFTEQIVSALQSSVVQTSWRDDFAATFDDLVMPLVTDARDLDDATRFDDVRAHLDRLLHYNVTGGKAYRALLVRLVADSLRAGGALRRVHAVGWALEIFQAMASWQAACGCVRTRRGKPLVHEVGTPCAINDSLLLTVTYRLLATKFGPLFDKLLTLLRHGHADLRGPALDTASKGKVQHATRTVRHRAVQGDLLHHPHAPGGRRARRCPAKEEAALLANVSEAKHIGQLFQEQDDYLDVFGDPTVTGKVGTDVVDGKTTWIFAYALARADDVQRTELLQHYGSKEADVPRVRTLFGDLGVHEEYAKRQQEGTASCLACALPQLQAPAMAILAELTNRKA